MYLPGPAGTSRFGLGGHGVFMGRAGSGSGREAPGPAGQEGDPSVVSSRPVGSCQHVCGVHGAGLIQRGNQIGGLVKRPSPLCIFRSSEYQS